MLETETCALITRILLARTAFGRPLYTVNAFLVDGLLIDSGPPATAGELVTWCRGRGVRQAVNTHHHEDHSGGDWAVQRRLGVPLAVPPLAVPILASFYRLEFYRRVVWGQPRNVTAQPLSGAVETERFCFEIVPTPGHSPDHVCFFEPQQGWLFSGDLFIHERVRYARPEEDIAGELDSLRRVLALRPRRLICSHAGFVEDACGALGRKIAYWEGLAAQAQALCDEGLSPRQIRDRLLGPEGWGSRVTGGHSAKVHLIRGLLKVRREA